MMGDKGEDDLRRLDPDDWALQRALTIQAEHGDRGPLHIAEMLGEFALAGDVKSIRTYQAIATAYETLLIARLAKH